MSLFEELDLIYEYTIEQALEDGVLVEPYPGKWPKLYLSAGVHAACEPEPDDYRNYDQRAIPLIQDAIVAAQKAIKTGAQPPLTLEHTIAGTVLVCANEHGGLTICTPGER